MAAVPAPSRWTLLRPDLDLFLREILERDRAGLTLDPLGPAAGVTPLFRARREPTPAGRRSAS